MTQEPHPPTYGVGPAGVPAWGPPPPGPLPRDPDARPGTVTAAAIVTFVLSGLVLLLLLVLDVTLLASRDGFLRGFQDSSGLRGDPQQWFVGLLVVLLVLTVWTLASIVLAVLVLKRRNWARIALVVSSVLTVLASLVAITGGVSVLTLAGGVAVVICLFTGGAGDWFHHEHLYSPPRMPKL